ncbi:MAG TPA: methylmalonyl-CoA mutase family protein, partial [Myxococcota bacterium]|nr:methylmalonyl-CoA mutase family protein [Myxococcota bacterium]
LAAAVSDALSLLRGAAFDVVFLETAGIGQSDSEIIDQVDCSLYVMTPEYGAPSQLEKIDMIDFADLVVLNKCDRQGAADALRDVRKQWRRNRGQPALADEAVPVFPTIARSWDDPGIERLSQALQARLRSLGLGELLPEREPAQAAAELPGAGGLVPGSRRRYLAEIAETARSYRARIEAEAERAALADGHARVLASLGSAAPPHPLGPIDPASRVTADASPDDEPLRARLLSRYAEAVAGIDPGVVEAAAAWPEIRERYEAASQRYVVRERTIEVANRTETLAGTALPKVALPRARDWGELVRYLALENRPGSFPYTAGVFPFKRSEEDPARMFAGEGGPERTNRRFHYLSTGQPAARLSTAFDSVTLYGRDPAERPDVFGKVGNSGVSVCTLDDAKRLYSGFDLSAATTSVSLTINGPAPMVLAFFLNAAI